MLSSHLILCCLLLLLPPVPPSIRVFSNESSLHMRWPKYWSFSFSISPSNEHPGLISFRMDWLDLLAVQGTLKSLLQHHSSKASILQCSAFFTIQFSHPYMTTGKTIALTRWTSVGKVMSLLFKMLSRSDAKYYIGFLSFFLFFFFFLIHSFLFLFVCFFLSVLHFLSSSCIHAYQHNQFSSVQLLSHVQLFVTLWTAACQASLSITNSWSLLRLMSIELVMPTNHLILCHPLFLPPSIFPSIRVFSNESLLHIR